VRKADNLPTSRAVVMKSGNLNFLSFVFLRKDLICVKQCRAFIR